MSEIEKLCKSLSEKEYYNDEWSKARSFESYEQIEIEYSFGKRKCLKKRNQDLYEATQSSRGLVDIKNYGSDEEILEQVDVDELFESDLLRIKEIDQLIKEEIVKLPEKAKMAELGFRIPKLIKYYQENYGMTGKGFDVVRVNVLVGKRLGYNVEEYDFTEPDRHLDLEGADLIICYHMLEHITDPLKSIKRIFDSMKSSAYFHVEVPIEPDGPRLRYAHLFPFHPYDLGHMLEEAGFKILTGTNITHSDGPWIERYTVIKE